MDLYVASGRHGFTDDAGQSEAPEAADTTPDVVFVEAPDRRVGRGEYLVALAYAPLLVATAHLWQSVFLRVARRLSGGGSGVDRRRARSHGTEVIPVDVPHTVHVYEQRGLWGIANWTAVGWPLVAGFDPLSSAYFAAVLFQGVVVFGAYVAATVPSRDRYMAERIAEHADDYDEARLVTGSGHHERIASHLAGHPGVNVINPAGATTTDRAASTGNE